MDKIRLFNRKWSTLFTLAVFCCASAACKMQPFSQVRVKASPAFRVSIGEYTLDISKKVNAEKLEEYLKNNDNLKVYRYYPTAKDVKNPNQERFLIQVPLDQKKIEQSVITAWKQADPNSDGFVTIPCTAKSVAVPIPAECKSIKGSKDLAQNNESLNSIFKALHQDGISMTEIPVYVGMSISDLPSATMKGRVTELKANDKEIASTGTTLQISSPCDLEKHGTVDKRKYTGTIPGSKVGGLEAAIDDAITKEKLDKLTVKYDIDVESLTASKEELNKITADAQIQPVLFIELPLGFKADGKEIHLFEGHESLKKYKEKEIFNRDEDWKFDEKKKQAKFVKFLQSVQVILDIHNTTGLEDFALTLMLKDKTNSKKIEKKAFVGIGSKHSIVFTFNENDRKIIMENRMFPEISITPSKKDYYIKRDGKLMVNLAISAGFDIDHTQPM